MKIVCSTLFLVVFACASSAQVIPVLRWERIVGNINAPGVNNPVAGVPSGGLPWTTTAGAASVNILNGAITFQVQGLVLVGGNFTGTTDQVTTVLGTLICNAGTPTQAFIDTPPVPLSPVGDAQFTGTLVGIPAACATPIFLIRQNTPTPGPWIATGAVLTISAI
jgi:hypothetical protein